MIVENRNIEGDDDSIGIGEDDEIDDIWFWNDNDEGEDGYDTEVVVDGEGGE